MQRRTVHAQIIVEFDAIARIDLVDAVARYFESKGFKAAASHVYPEDAIVIECPEPLPDTYY